MALAQTMPRKLAAAGLLAATLSTGIAMAAPGTALADRDLSAADRNVPSNATESARTDQQVSAAHNGPTARACGYLGDGNYNHCDNGTGQNVMLTVNYLWGYAGQYCVPPGVTEIQWAYEWRIYEAYWNGGVGCAPGAYQ